VTNFGVVWPDFWPPNPKVDRLMASCDNRRQNWFILFFKISYW